MSDAGIPFMFQTAAEYEAWLREMAEAKGTLEDVAAKADRARYAELAGEVWDFAGYAGVDVPKPYKKLIGAIAFFGPMLKLLPGYQTAPEWFRKAFDRVLEGAALANRTFVE